MVTLSGVALVVGGLVLLFAGAVLSVYGVAILGVVLGGAGGFLVAPTVGNAIGLEGVLAVVAATALGIVVGLLVTYLVLSMAIAAVSFLAGAYVGLVVVAPFLPQDWAAFTTPVALVVGMAAAGLATVMRRTVLVLVTSAIGAILASGSLTLDDLAAAQAELSLDPLLIDVGSPILLGLFVLGVLTQVGLFRFGYVTKLVALLPGASVFQDQADDDAPSAGR